MKIKNKITMSDIRIEDFKYHNRCIVITEKDNELLNYPTIKPFPINNDKTHISFLVNVDCDLYKINKEEYKKLHFCKIIITSNPTKNSCLDYKFYKSRTLENIMCSHKIYDNKSSYIKHLCNNFNITKEQIEEYTTSNNNYYEWYKENKIILKTIIINNEIKIVNNILDKIKAYHNYTELTN
jgi:hypothetical protein